MPRLLVPTGRGPGRGVKSSLNESFGHRLGTVSTNRACLPHYLEDIDLDDGFERHLR